MEISFNRFRCFGEQQSARIAPVTLLVGENSAGKSTFMAGLRYILDFVGRSAPSFNKDPFFLGGYKNIAHYRGGSYGRATTFTIEISEQLSGSDVRSRQSELFPSDKVAGRTLELALTFADIEGDATPIEYNISVSNTSVRILLGEKKVRAIVRDMARAFEHEMTTRPISRVAVPGSDFLILEYVLRDLSLLLRSREPAEFSENDAEASKIVEAIWTTLRRLSARRRAQVYALAPVRTRPLRSYDPTQLSQSSEGDQLIAKLGRMARVDAPSWQRVKASLETYGTATGLFESIRIHKLGRGDADPFQILVKAAGRETNIIDVGYGVSQVLPFFIILAELDQHSTLLIQQPEVHLHPTAQAALASVIAEAASKPKSPSFVIETHSDFIVDRIRMAVRGRLLKEDDLAILFFEKEKYNSRVTVVDINGKGEMVDPPKAYREFFLRESMSIMGF